ncbi:transcription factor RFX4-like [Cherax quadricarinatus]|uniref:transcription factor RFX4-like n=1 Tax=Cherax quadricarinatus TaxID=27406 RepID=UPI00387E5168
MFQTTLRGLFILCSRRPSGVCLSYVPDDPQEFVYPMFQTTLRGLLILCSRRPSGVCLSYVPDDPQEFVYPMFQTTLRGLLILYSRRPSGVCLSYVPESGSESTGVVERQPSGVVTGGGGGEEGGREIDGGDGRKTCRTGNGDAVVVNGGCKGGGGGGGGSNGGGNRCNGGGGSDGGGRGGGGRGLRPHSTPATLLWLEENYEMAEGVCIPRNTLYLHYVDFCDKRSLQPVNAASFGKIIRQQFPGLTTRRLGTRGQSRYHYYGIAIREGSVYYEVHYSKKGNSSRDIKKESDKQVATFVMMYRTHCQRILDTVIRASFDEIQSFLLHFWQGMPPHLGSILSTNVLVNLVGVCDSILYRAICSVLMPSVLQAIPDSLTQVIRKFTHDLDSWLKVALDDLPDNLRQVKIDLACRFSRMLRRQTSLNHLCQASRMVLHAPDITQQMVQDWRQVDLETISRHTLYSMDKHTTSGVTVDLIMSLYSEFERLLEEGAPLEAYSEWLEAMVERCVLLGARKNKAPIHKVAHSFLLMWSCFGTRVIRDMTLHSAPSFGSFHLLHLMFDDYVLYLVESLHAEEKARELLNNIATDSPPDCSDPGLRRYSPTYPDNEDSLHALSFLMGGSTTVVGGPGAATPTTPALSPTSQTAHELHISPTPTTMLGLESSLVEEDGSMDYITGLATTTTPGVGGGGGGSSTPTAPGAAVGAGMGGDYTYTYDYEARSYRLPSTLVARNYLYPPTTVAINQYYQGGSGGGEVTSEEERYTSHNTGGGSVSLLHGGGGGGGPAPAGAGDSLSYTSVRTADAYVDCSNVYCPDQSLIYSANYYQTYDTSYYSNRFKTKDVEG